MKTDNRSFDEIIMFYYENNTCKQHIHGKQIKFGYKLLLAATPNEYLIYCIPYHESKSALLLEQTRFWLGDFVSYVKLAKKIGFFIGLLHLDELKKRHN